MKKGSTFLLRCAVMALGLIVLGLCIFTVPAGLRRSGMHDYRPIFYGLYLTAIPFFVALFQSMRLLDFIDGSKAFSDKSVSALKNIKYCALIISICFALGMPYIYYVGDRHDAPGVIVLGLVIVAASFVIAAAAGVLQKLVQHGLDLKAENDLTV